MEGGAFCSSCGSPANPQLYNQDLSPSGGTTRYAGSGGYDGAYDYPGHLPYSPPPPIYLPRQRPRWLVPTVVVLAILVLAAGAALGFTVSSSHDTAARAPAATNNGGSAQSPQTQVPASPSSTPSSTAAGETASQEASQLSTLLAQSTGDRAQVVDATTQIASCGDLGGAQSTLQQAAAQRGALLSQLGQLDLSALPSSSPLISDLQSAWQSSEESDTSYAQWAQDEMNNGCVPSDNSDLNFEAAQADDQQAQTAKQAFVTVWDPIATSYGLTTYTADQL